jgi:hypothetical protein
MNALNFSQLKNQLQMLIDRNPTATLSWLGDRINEALIELGNAFRFDSLRRTAYFSVTAPNVTGTVAVSVQGTAVTGDGTSFSQNMIGQKILLNGQFYEIATVTSATALTINRPFEGTSAITADTTAIYYDLIQLPWGCDYSRIQRVVDPKNETTLRPLTKEKFDNFFPNPTTSGNPRIVCFTGYKEDRYPSSGTATLAASSSTTSAIFPVGTSTVDDYYNNWYLINTTRTGVSRVTDYVGSTTRTATISPAITGQVATDTVYLQKRSPYISLYPLPDSAQYLIMSYYILPNKMVNDYDVPFEIPERFHRAIYLRAACFSNLILDDARKRECERDYAQILFEMNNEYNVLAGQEFDKETIEQNNNVIDFNEYKYPLG